VYTPRIYTAQAFEWDPAQRETNLRKHGVDFARAVRIFEAPVLERQDRRRDYGEPRFVALGAVEELLLAVVYTGRIDMKKRRIVKYNPRKHEDRTNRKRVLSLTDEDIERAVAGDPDAAPIMDQAWWREAQVVLPTPKVPVSVRLDRDVLEWFKDQGPRYQSRMNAVLRAFMLAHRRAE
jgi:uncharacterized protein (DUF4415 family)